jgi:hypothetical protein
MSPALSRLEVPCYPYRRLIRGVYDAVLATDVLTMQLAGALDVPFRAVYLTQGL